MKHGVLKNIILTTCTQWPDLSTSDQLFAKALVDQGFRVTIAPWNKDQEPFDIADVIILRSNWDYHYHLNEFIGWLKKYSKKKIIFNHPTLVLWNLDKSYLQQLQARGMPTADMRIIEPSVSEIEKTCKKLGWQRAVIKPLIGASGHNVYLVDYTDLHNLYKKIEKLHDQSRIIIQEFMPEVTEFGEISSIFFNGQFSHAILKKPAKEDFRCNSQYNATYQSYSLAHPHIQQAIKSLEVLSRIPLYTRVDGVLRNNQFILMELELNEPHLFLDYDPQSSELFTKALIYRLNST